MHGCLSPFNAIEVIPPGLLPSYSLAMGNVFIGIIVIKTIFKRPICALVFPKPTALAGILTTPQFRRLIVLLLYSGVF